MANLKGTIGSIILYTFLVALAILCFLPFYLMIMNATHTSADISQKLNLLPGGAFAENYRVLSESVKVWVGFKNSIIVSGIGTALSAYVGALTAYGFSKYKFLGNNALFWIILGSMMVPPQLGIIGFFTICSKLNLIDNLLALILPMMANAQLVFFVKLYMDSAVPDSLIEAARIDGASEFGIFNKIVLPVCVPSIATMSMFTFISSWNNLITPSIILQSESNYTLPLFTVMAKGVYRTNFGAVYAAIAISIVPIMVAFAFCSKYIIGGITAGAVKE
ncbi:MAG: carbohydrate ABC transporter permease [Clostridiaceae bacterium]|nr:carbohydrate ABC transporter permease [Clostridiaceae bacterium]